MEENESSTGRFTWKRVGLISLGVVLLAFVTSIAFEASIEPYDIEVLEVKRDQHSRLVARIRFTNRTDEWVEIRKVNGVPNEVGFFEASNTDSIAENVDRSLPFPRYVSTIKQGESQEINLVVDEFPAGTTLVATWRPKYIAGTKLNRFREKVASWFDRGAHPRYPPSTSTIDWKTQVALWIHPKVMKNNVSNEFVVIE